MEHKPLISVIMSVYNEEKYIKDAVESILNQTRSEFELIIIDDCSTDRTVEIIRTFGDDRIHLIQNESNQGLTKNLNYALSISRGQFIARMDGDDISMPDRFARQIDYLETHPELVLVSCQTMTFGEQNLVQRRKEDASMLRCMMLIHPVLAHPGFMVRSWVFLREGYRYDESFRQAQDYDLVARITEKFQVGICPYILLKYRTHTGQVSDKAMGKQFANADRVRSYLLSKLGIHWTPDQIGQYHKLILETHTEDIQDFVNVEHLLSEIIEKNRINGIYPQKTLEKCLRAALCLWVIRDKSGKIYRKATKIWNHNPAYTLCYMGQWLDTFSRKCSRIRNT